MTSAGISMTARTVPRPGLRNSMDASVSHTR